MTRHKLPKLQRPADLCGFALKTSALSAEAPSNPLKDQDMTNPTQEARELKPFEREERYIVFKKSQLSEKQLESVERLIYENARGPAASWHDRPLPTVECVVIESDWPEYEPVWAMLEKRCTSGEAPVSDGMAERLLRELAAHADRFDKKAATWGNQYPDGFTVSVSLGTCRRARAAIASRAVGRGSEEATAASSPAPGKSHSCPR